MAEGFVSVLGIRLSAPPGGFRSPVFHLRLLGTPPAALRSPIFGVRFLGVAGEAPETTPWLWIALQQEALGAMLKNVADQTIGAQMISASDGSAFTGSVTCYVTADGGTQAVGATGSGACTHEGNGVHTYAPSEAETNADHICFTFIGTGAVPVTINVYTDAAYDRLGAPDGASVAADVAAVKAETAAILEDTGTTLPAAIGAIDTVGETDGSVTAA